MSFHTGSSCFLQLDEEKTVSYVAALQNADGSFRGDEWGEVDTRFTYCALCCLCIDPLGLVGCLPSERRQCSLHSSPVDLERKTKKRRGCH